MSIKTEFQSNLIAYKTQTDCFLDIAFQAAWDNIPITKAYIENALIIGKVSNDNIHKIGTAASELLENAVKYSIKDGIQIVIKKLENSPEIEIRILNYANDNDAERLLKRVAEINAADPLAYYLLRMKESVKDKSQNAGLGLARVSYEAGARIEASYNKEHTLIEIRVYIKT